MKEQVEDIAFNWFERNVTLKMTEWWDGAISKIIYDIMELVSILFSILAIGAVGYVLWHCIKFMFLGNDKDIQKIILGYFALLLIRIFVVIVRINWNIG